NTQRHVLHITALNAAFQDTPSFHHLCYKSHVIGCEHITIYWARFQIPCYYREIFQKPKKSPVILCLTRESNPRPLVWKLDLQILQFLAFKLLFLAIIVRVLFHQKCTMQCCCGCVWDPSIIFIGIQLSTECVCVPWMTSLLSIHRILKLCIFLAQLLCGGAYS
ncbi:hypothetical protein SFRURICE_004130, partial [Spodoptera frugiperda]